MRGRIVAQLLLSILLAGCGSMTVQEYTSQDGRYRVQFTGKPTIQEKTVQTPVGPVITRIAISEDWSRTARMVMYADYPPHLIHAGNRDGGLDGACQGMVSEAQLVTLSKVPITLNGHPGREVTFDSQPGRPGGKVVGRARLYLVGNRLYQVLIAGPDGRVPPETIESYFNSFSLLDQGPGPAGPGAPAGPRPVGPPPAGPPPSGPRQVDRRPVDRPAPASSPRKRPGPEPGPSRALAFYDIPEPASARIDADIPGMGSTPENSEVPGLGGSPEPTATAGGAAIRTFKWVDENADVVGGYGDAARADGTKDQHFRLEIDMPSNTIVESVVITSGPNHRWVTKPSDQFWPIAIFQRGRPVIRSHVAQVGVFSGPQAFDLYFNTGIGIGPGSAFELEIVFSIGGRRITVASGCQRPNGSPVPLADARPAQPASGPPAMPSMPAPGPAATRVPVPVPVPAPPPADRPGQRGGESTEVPTSTNLSSGGATILSFDWVDRKEDVVGMSGRLIAPGGGKDEHFQLVMDLPAATIIEEVAITGGGVLRWTTKPSAKYWPVAVVSKQQPRNRASRCGSARSPADGRSTCTSSRTATSAPTKCSGSRSSSSSAGPGIT